MSFFSRLLRVLFLELSVTDRTGVFNELPALESGARVSSKAEGGGLEADQRVTEQGL